MADERCVYENVLRDASSLSVDIFVKWITILMETSDQPYLPAERIFGTVMQLFRQIALDGEAHIRNAANLKADIADVIKHRSCEHGARYKGLVDYDAFWDEKRLRTLKDARRATLHHHPVVKGISLLIVDVKTETKKEVKEWKE